MPFERTQYSFRPSTIRIAFAALAVVGGFALCAQFAMTFLGAGLTLAGLGRTVVMLLSFFTIVTNLAVAIAASSIAYKPDCRWARPRVATALAVYVTVVFAVYELVLRRLFHPQGLGIAVDTIFHDVVPIAYVVLWWLFIRKGTLRWHDALPWLIAPAVYALWVGLLGLLVGGSPYFFLDVTTLGGLRVAINIIGLIGIFWIVGMAFIALDRRWFDSVALTKN